MKKNKTIIIAEAGVNHGGSMKLAKRLIDIASRSGADYVKFQSFLVDEMILKDTPQAEYQRKNLKKNISQYQMLKKYELSKQHHNQIYLHCKKRKIKFISTPFDIKSLNFLKKFKMDYLKIPSGEITNKPLLENISKTKSKYLLSTGMSNLKEINQAYKILNRRYKNKITIMHCTSNYPSENSELNLNALSLIKKNFKCDIGYSDHSKSILVPCLAVAMGAKVIEKHFTISNNMYGPDHKASLNPKELKKMVDMIKETEVIMGLEKKQPNKKELITRKLVRKSIVSRRDIIKGEKFTLKNITTKRPGIGLSPFLINKILGKKSKRKFKKDSIIKI